MTGGVIVPWYPIPIRLVTTVFFAAIARSRAIASCSGTASGRASGSVVRIDAGTVWSSSSAAFGHAERVEHVREIGG